MNDVIASYNRLRDRSISKYEASKKGQLPKMDEETLKRICMDNDGYETPELNDSLYCHFKGFTKIEGLSAYTELKALWLESNGLSRIENLEPLVKLRCLYLSKNQITQIENLNHLRNLVTLDISDNCIETISGLTGLISLSTLNISKNRLEDYQGINHLESCHSITNLDISNNIMQDPLILDAFKRMTGLRALRITGNPIVSKTKQFRKHYLAAMPNLCYLDRPIFPLERAQVKGWKDGGIEGEQEARQKFLKEKNENERKVMQDFRDWKLNIQESALRKQRENRSLRREQDLEREKLSKETGMREKMEVCGDGIVKKGASFWASETPEGVANSHSTVVEEVSSGIAPREYEDDSNKTFIQEYDLIPNSSESEDSFAYNYPPPIPVTSSKRLESTSYTENNIKNALSENLMLNEVKNKSEELSKNRDNDAVARRCPLDRSKESSDDSDSTNNSLNNCNEITQVPSITDTEEARSCTSVKSEYDSGEFPNSHMSESNTTSYNEIRNSDNSIDSCETTKIHVVGNRSSPVQKRSSEIDDSNNSYSMVKESKIIKDKVGNKQMAGSTQECSISSIEVPLKRLSWDELSMQATSMVPRIIPELIPSARDDSIDEDYDTDEDSVKIMSRSDILEELRSGNLIKSLSTN